MAYITLNKFYISIIFWGFSLLGGLSVQAAGAAGTLTVNVATMEATCGRNNGTITVFASGGTAPYQYSMDGGVTFQPSNVFPNVGPNTYSISVTDASGIPNTGTAIAAISNLPGPTVSATATAASCLDNDGGIQVSGLGGTSPYQYSIDGTSFQSSAAFTAQASGNYTATIKDLNGCTGTKAVSIPLNNNLSVSTRADTTICEGSSVVLKSVSNATSFSWAPSTGLSDAASPNPTATPATTTIYNLTATLGTCQRSAATTVTVNPAPLAIAGPDTTICFGKSVPLSGSGGNTYSWSPATYLDHPTAADPIVNRPPTGSITYHLVVTDANGCHSLQNAQTTVTVRTPPRVFAGNDTSVLANQSIPLHAVDEDNGGFSQYEWSPATGLNNPELQDPTATLEETTTYTVTGTAADGCTGTASVTIKVFSASDLFVPTAFSPNGDGHNDILHVIAIGIKDFAYFAVYNRNGQRVFYTTDPAKGWDGTINGQPQIMGTYVWMTGGVNEGGMRVERKGTVMLIR